MPEQPRYCTVPGCAHSAVSHLWDREECPSPLADETPIQIPRTYVIGLPVIVSIHEDAGPLGTYVEVGVDLSDLGVKALTEAVDNAGDDETTDETIAADAATLDLWIRNNDVHAAGWVTS